MTNVKKQIKIFGGNSYKFSNVQILSKFLIFYSYKYQMAQHSRTQISFLNVICKLKYACDLKEKKKLKT